MSSSSDDIEVLEAPVNSPRPRNARTASAQAASSRLAEQPIDIGSSDSDDPVFLSETVGAKLAAKFTFNDGTVPSFQTASASASSSRSRSTSVVAGRKRKSLEKSGQGVEAYGQANLELKTDSLSTPKKESKSERASNARRAKKEEKDRSTSVAASESGAEDKAKVKPLRKARRGVNDVLVPTYIAEPLPVPDWLGQPVVLNQLAACPVCQRPLKKSESGPARWVSDHAHIVRRMRLMTATHLVMLSSVIPTAKRPAGSARDDQRRP